MTSGVQAILILHAALTPEEQEEAFAQLRKRRIDALGDAEREMESHVRSLRRVAEAIGHAPGVTEYREVQVEGRLPRPGALSPRAASAASARLGEFTTFVEARTKKAVRGRRGSSFPKWA